MNITEEFDTIAAISTPFGVGGIGVIRISGDKAFEIISKIFTNPNFKPTKFNRGWIIDNNIKIDEVIVLPFFAPNSYTGEDVIEIQCHGGINIVNNILELVIKNGARLAEKGEYTKRAFLNKKMDLSQAEAVADIIHSKTSNFTKVSVKNLTGILKEKIGYIRNDIFEILSKITAAIDFPEDVREPEYSYLTEKLETILGHINSVLKDAKASNIMRQGISVAIVGRPNVGKSSLFNALLNQTRAIVTDIAGTTRDVLKETLDLGVPVTLIDTAGIRDGENKVEKIGIEFSKQSIDEADFVVFVYDAKEGIQTEDNEILNLIKNKKYIKVANKSDLIEEKSEDAISISVLTGEGIEKFKKILKSNVCAVESETLEYVTNIRQQGCLEKAKEALEQALLASRVHELQDMISIDIKTALLALDELTGELITDEILDNVFKHFCIGK